MNPSSSSLLRPRSPSRRKSFDRDLDPGPVDLGNGPLGHDLGVVRPLVRQRHHTGGAKGGEHRISPLNMEFDDIANQSLTVPHPSTPLSPLPRFPPPEHDVDRKRRRSRTREASEHHQQPPEQTSAPEEEYVRGGPEDLFRRKLAFFFLDPVQKYQARKQIPWKLSLQFLKVVLVTIVLLIFGSYRYAHTKYYTDNQITFEHLFLKGWDPTREIHAYPPSTGIYALYEKANFYEYFDYVAKRYDQVEDIAVNPVFRNSTFDFCLKQFDDGQVFRNLTWNIDFEDLNRNESCLTIPWDHLKNMSSASYLPAKNFDVNWNTLTTMHINFTLSTLTYLKLGPLLGPECFAFRTQILFDNSDYDGQIPVSLTVAPHRRRCPKPRGIGSLTSVAVRSLNIVVIIVCILSLLLCCRALFRAQKLRREAQRFFKQNLGWDLTTNEKLEFLNGWYIIICISDVLIIIGCIIKEGIESRNTFGDLWDFCSLFLGLGNLLVWIGMLRYLGFFKTYNVLILTLKGALPNVLRFLLCALIIYFGFVFCGWVILGPYHFGFGTIMTTSETLFSLINGDDMFATFSSVPETSTLIWTFSRIYLYFFISLFIYVILSLFIAIIMDTYEVIKEYYTHGFPKKRMHEFYKKAQYNPSSGVFREDNDMMEGVVRILHRVFSFDIVRQRQNQQHRENGHLINNDEVSILT